MTVDQQIETIKAQMPETYKGIHSKATEIGKAAFSLVRRGLGGEPNCFYAFERGYVVGTPFSITDIMAVSAQTMVQFGCQGVSIWPMTHTPPPIGTPTAEPDAGNSTPARALVAGLGESEQLGKQAGRSPAAAGLSGGVHHG